MKCYTEFLFNVNNKLLRYRVGLKTDSETPDLFSIDELVPLIDVNDIVLLEEDSEIRKTWQSFINDLSLSIVNKSLLSLVSINDISGENIVSNCSLNTLSKLYNIDFPEGFDNTRILLLNDFGTVSNNLTFGRIIDLNGQELFILKNLERSIKSFKEYLSSKKEASNKTIEETPETLEILEYLSSKKSIKEKIGNVNDLILTYLNNKNLFLGLRTQKNNIEIKSYLEKLCGELGLAKEYTISNDICKSIDNSCKWNYLKGELLKQVTFSKLKLALNRHNIKIENFEEKISKEAFEELIGGIYNDFNPKLSVLKNLFLYLRYVDKGFNYVLQSIDSDNKLVNLKFIKLTVTETLDIGYNSMVLEAVVEKFLDYYIFKTTKNNSPYYFASKLYLKKASTIEGDSIEVCKEQILKRSKVSLDNKLWLYLSNPAGIVTTDLSMSEGGVITKYSNINISRNAEMNIPVILKNILRNTGTFDLLLLALNETLNVNNEILSLIKLTVTSSELATLFIYTIFEDSSNPSIEVINNALNILSQENLATLNYYIRNSFIKGELNHLKIVPISDEFVENYKNNLSYPDVFIIQQIANALSETFPKLKVELTNSTELNNDQLKNKKAFIKNGIVYINLDLAKASDLIHEYTHLLLGILKAHESTLEMYQKLLNEFYKLVNKGNFEKFSLNYSELALDDIIEEYFANQFGQYIENHLVGLDLFSEIFNQILDSKKVSPAVSSIFNLNVQKAVDSISKDSALKNLFYTFSSLIKENVDKINESWDSKTLSDRRKITNYIELNLGELITEKCE